MSMQSRTPEGCADCGGPLLLMNFDDDTELEYCDECGEVAS